MTTDFGSVREVWFADMATPTTRDSFLIRDDSYVVTGQTLGRTVRLGDPIDTGSDSGWKQNTWEGGEGQRLWADSQMYREGSADIFTDPGRARLWPGISTIATHPSRRVEGFMLSPGSSGDGVDTPLWFGETANHLGILGSPVVAAADPGGGWALNRYDPTTDTFRTVKFFSGPIVGMAPVMSDDGSSEWMHVLTQNGQYWMVKDDGSQQLQDTNATLYGYQSHSLAAFGGAMYYCQGTWLGKRVAVPPYGVLGTHTVVKDLKGSRWTRGLAVWQNRLWFGVQYGGGKAVLYTSDGVSANEAAQWEDEFIIQNIISHYGALYIAGYKPPGRWSNGTVAQVWKYTGSALTKLWEHGNGRDGKLHMACGMTTSGPNLVWTQDGFDSNEDDDQRWPNRRPSLMFYDAEKDAIFEGPGFAMDPLATDLRMVDVRSYNNSLVFSALDTHSYGGGLTWPTYVGIVKGTDDTQHTMNGGDHAATFNGQSFTAQPTTRELHITSADYSGPSDVTDAAKAWLAVRVKSRIPRAGGQVEVTISFNEDPTEYSVVTVNYDSLRPDWVVTEGRIYVGSPQEYPIATSATYHVYLRNINTAGAQAEVDSVGVRYALLPDKQRTWRMRFLCSDAQERLAGTANPLTTGLDQEQVLEQYWSYRRPFLMWGPFAYPATDPADLNDATKIEVRAQDFALNEYREDSQSSGVLREVTMSLIEVATDQVWT